MKIKKWIAAGLATIMMTGMLTVFLMWRRISM